MIVVSDASPINILVRIGCVDLLAGLFQTVLLPPAVVRELTHEATPKQVREFISTPPAWLQCQAPMHTDPGLLSADAGEAEAICLAIELRADALLADDRKARAIAHSRGLRTIGTVGILELGAARGLVDLRIAFSHLRATDFRIDEEILREALRRLEQPRT